MSEELKEKYGKRTIDEYIKELKIKLTYKEAHNGLEYIYFGTYEKPNKMTIYKDNIQKGKKIAVKEKINGLEKINIQDIVKAHELFHHFEETRSDLYVNTNKITLWRLGKYEYKSKLISQAEIASMAFAKHLLDLSFSPNVLDVLLLYPHNEEQSNQLYRTILNNKSKE